MSEHTPFFPPDSATAYAPTAAVVGWLGDTLRPADEGAGEQGWQGWVGGRAWPGVGNAAGPARVWELRPAFESHRHSTPAGLVSCLPLIAPAPPPDLMVTSGGGPSGSSGPGSPRAPSPQQRQQSVFNQLATQLGVLGPQAGPGDVHSVHKATVTRGEDEFPTGRVRVRWEGLWVGRRAQGGAGRKAGLVTALGSVRRVVARLIVATPTLAASPSHACLSHALPPPPPPPGALTPPGARLPRRRHLLPGAAAVRPHHRLH